MNAKNTFASLFDHGVVPIINENDTVAVEEIKLGDNDNLSAMVATLIEANLLLILSDIDGLYTDDPAYNPDAVLIPVVEKLTPQIERLAKKSKSEMSTGGMVTKIQAAKLCIDAGIVMIIANGKNPETIKTIFEGNFRGTVFIPGSKKISVRKQWIGLFSHPAGAIVIDDGAANALLKQQKSLLASGITAVRGEFKTQEIISVFTMSGKEIGKGISAYSAAEISMIKGKKSSEIEKLLGCKAPAEVIHRNNLVMGEE